MTSAHRSSRAWRAAFVGALVCAPALDAVAQPAASSPTAGWRVATPKPPCANARISKLSPEAVETLNRPEFIEATVTVSVEILPPGIAGQVSVTKTSGYPAFDAQALDAYKALKCSFPEPLTAPFMATQSFTFRKAP